MLKEIRDAISLLDLDAEKATKGADGTSPHRAAGTATRPRVADAQVSSDDERFQKAVTGGHAPPRPTLDKLDRLTGHAWSTARLKPLVDARATRGSPKRARVSSLYAREAEDDLDDTACSTASS